MLQKNKMCHTCFKTKARGYLCNIAVNYSFLYFLRKQIYYRKIFNDKFSYNKQIKKILKKRGGGGMLNTVGQ